MGLLLVYDSKIPYLLEIRSASFSLAMFSTFLISNSLSVWLVVCQISIWAGDRIFLENSITLTAAVKIKTIKKANKIFHLKICTTSVGFFNSYNYSFLSFVGSALKYKIFLGTISRNFVDFLISTVRKFRLWQCVSSLPVCPFLHRHER